MITVGHDREENVLERRYHFQFGAVAETVLTINTPFGQVRVDQVVDQFETTRLGGWVDDQFIAYVCIDGPEHGVLPYCHVGETIVAPGYRKHRLSRTMIEWWVINNEQPLLSDHRQSPAAARNWFSMITRDPKLRYGFWRPGHSPVAFAHTGGRLTPDPWIDDDVRILACPP